MRLPQFSFRLRSLKHQGIIVYALWGFLLCAAIWALVAERYSIAFVALATIGLSMLPSFFIDRFKLKLPVSFFAAISIFVFATIFLGEAFDFYERYWWWDLVLHGGSAMGFGLISFLFVFMMFQGDRYAAPPIAVAFVAYCCAVTIGTTWEIFEFGMDQLFGLNMQKSGLLDTMSDLMIDAAGAGIGSASGFLYLKGIEVGGVSNLIDEFIKLNKERYTKFRRRG